MRRAQLCLRGLLAVLALAFLGATPAVADPSDLGITVGELLQIVEDSRDPAVPIEIERKSNSVLIEILDAGRVIELHIGNGSDDLLSSPAERIWVGFGLVTHTGLDSDIKKFRAAEKSATSVLNALWRRLMRGEDFETWEARVGAAMSESNFSAYSEFVNDNRVGVFPHWVFFDTFTECQIDTSMTLKLYREMQAEGVCPEWIAR